MLSFSFQNQLSGYLLRKFKNSNGWQKLWVVFTNFCLFFYKTFQVSSHSQRDEIEKPVLRYPYNINVPLCTNSLNFDLGYPGVMALTLSFSMYDRNDLLTKNSENH